MTKLMTVAVLVLGFLTAPAFAGGVHCKQCPSESRHCMPLPNCHEGLDDIDDLDNGICPTNSVMACKGKDIGSSCGTRFGNGSCELNQAKNPKCFCFVE